jgi:hypothetical protein
MWCVQIAKQSAIQTLSGSKNGCASVDIQVQTSKLLYSASRSSGQCRMYGLMGSTSAAQTTRWPGSRVVCSAALMRVLPLQRLRASVSGRVIATSRFPFDFAKVSDLSNVWQSSLVRQVPENHDLAYWPLWKVF